MTTSDEGRENRVGVSELRDHLSRYLRGVADGTEIVVTVRGREIARLAPIGPDPFAELRARGLIRDPIGPRVPLDELPQTRLKGDGPSLSDIVIEQR